MTLSIADSTAPETIKFGKIAFTGKGIDPQETDFDRLAIGSRGELFVLSIVTESQKVKAIRAILAGGAKCNVSASGVTVNKPGDEDWKCRHPGSLYLQGEGYNCYSHKLGYSQVHSMFVARTPGFMNVVTEESLWAELNDSRFTTPLCREWAKYVEAELRKKKLLELCLSHRCECGILTATTSDLDLIVETGLKTKAIVIADPNEIVV